MASAARTSNDGADQPLLSSHLDPGYHGITTTSNDATSTAGTPSDERGTFRRNLNTFDAFAIVISIVIGSGVFTSPGAIDTNVPSPFMALATWAIGGVLAWTGATALAELGTAIPGEGGVQPYLQYIFGDAFGFLAAWTWIVAVMPATLAILSIAFVESIYSSTISSSDTSTTYRKTLSVIVLVVMTIGNCISTKASTRLNGIFVVTKFASILAIVAAGLAVVVVQVSRPEGGVVGEDWFRKSWFEYRETVNPDGSTTDWKSLGTWDVLGHLSAALYGALWAYSGWDKAIYVSAELSSPVRQLPLAINAALPTIIVCFLAANTAYYILLPWDVVSTTDSVAVTAIARLLGPTFGTVAALLICLVIAGSLLGNSFVASRMTVAAGNRKWFPRLFTVVGRLGLVPSHDTTTQEADGEATSDAPINALLLSAVLSTLYIIFGDFRTLLTFNGLGEYSFFFLTVLGVIILRFREPGLRRPYKPSIVVPVVFAVVSGFVVVRGAMFAPVQAGVLVGVWTVGLVFYWVQRR